MKKKIFNAILLLSAFLFFSENLISCTKKVYVKTIQHDSPLKIGFSIDTLIVERWRTDCDVFSSTARENGVSVIIQDAANSVSEQIRQINYLVSQKVDCLVIVAKEADSLSEVIQKAKSRGIPVIAYDRLLINSDIDLYITVDCRKVGALMAEAMIKQQPSGSFWCIYGSEADFNMTMLDNGVNKVLENTRVSVDVRYYTPDWNYDLAYQKMNSLLNQGLMPAAVICGNDVIAETVIRSISEHKLGKSIPVVGQDAEVLACRRIADGIQTATIYKPIPELAKKAAEVACRLAKGESALTISEVSEFIDNGYGKIPEIFLEPVLVTKENLRQVVVNSSFHSESEIYR